MKNSKAKRKDSDSSFNKKQEEDNIEKTYQKKSQIEHILLRTDSYIGSIEKSEDKLWIFDENLDKFVFKNTSYVPGLYKIFDEILVNASDNIQSM